GGLPGLILEAKSTDGIVSYTFQNFEAQTEDRVVLAKPSYGKEITWGDFERLVIGKLLEVEALSTFHYTVTNSDPNPNWTIEKSKFTIISAFKDRRKLREINKY
ncbi:MAG: hypothetical protein AAF705_10650, partial [Bacteroidota bacterium]